MVAAGTVFFAAAGKFFDRRPSARFSCFWAQIFFLIASFNVSRLTFLLVSITRFIALRHGVLWLVNHQQDGGFAAQSLGIRTSFVRGFQNHLCLGALGPGSCAGSSTVRLTWARTMADSMWGS